jgi:AIPR protein
MPDADAYKAQIVDALKQRYFPIIQQLSQNWTPEQHEKNRLSRALAALAIEKVTDVVPAQAANAVVDGGNDNGIDAVHFDRVQKRLWLIQSKAGGPPDLGDNKKFCDGIRDLIARRFDKFNDTFQRLQPDVEDALETEGLIIIGCPVHLGDELGPHATNDLNQLKTQLNEFVTRFDWKDLSLSVIHGWLTAEYAAVPLDVTLVLQKWYGLREPYPAFYGVVSARQLAELYKTHGNSLFQKNIRHYLGAQGVNSSITGTVQNKPEELFYLNNGLTAICTTITPVPGVTNDQGTFNLHGFSIVNGAQTVGSIASARNSPEEIPMDAKLSITLIQVGEAGADLGTLITRARNTQNAIQALYFAALDPQQERLRQELAVSGMIYHYRPSAEALHESETTITVEQAALALACFRGDTGTIVTAKKEIGQIYDSTGTYYPALFRAGLSGIRLCRTVRIFQYLNGIFASSEQAETDNSRRMFYRHGRFFVLHILARRHRSLLDKDEIVLSDDDKLQLSRVATELAELIYTTAETFFRRTKGYLSIFRNTTDAVPLAQEVLRRLAEQDATRAAAEGSGANADSAVQTPVA